MQILFGLLCLLFMCSSILFFAFFAIIQQEKKRVK